MLSLLGLVLAVVLSLVSASVDVVNAIRTFAALSTCNCKRFEEIHNCTINSPTDYCAQGIYNVDTALEHFNVNISAAERIQESLNGELHIATSNWHWHHHNFQKTDNHFGGIDTTNALIFNVSQPRTYNLFDTL